MQQQQFPFTNVQQSTTAPHGTAAGTTSAVANARSSATTPQSIQPPLTHFGSTEPKLLADMSFAELDAAIDHELLRNRDRLIPYLREMRSRFDGFQGTRNDLHPDTPQIGWQAWVESKKDRVGSLATVKRLLAAPKDAPAKLTPLQDAVVKALISQGYKKKEATMMVKAATGEDFESLFRSALTHRAGGVGTTGTPVVSPVAGEAEQAGEAESGEPEEEETHDESPDDVLEEEEDERPTVVDAAEELRAALAAERDTGIASEMLTAHLQAYAKQFANERIEIKHVSATVTFAGRDHRIIPGDYLEYKKTKLCKCVGVAEFMQRRRVKEWVDGKWGKECVVYSSDETGYRVITEEAARKLAPAALGSAEPSAAEGSPVVNPAPQEAEEPTV